MAILKGGTIVQGIINVTDGIYSPIATFTDLTVINPITGSITGSATSLKSPSTTGLGRLTGMAAGTTRDYTVPDANATLLYSGGALGTPSSGTLTNCTFPTLNQSTTGSSASVTHNGSRTDAAAYPVVWASGTPCPMYSCAAVTITSSTGILTATSFYASSLRVLKENISPTKINACNLLATVSIVDYNFISDPATPKIGFIADDTHSLLSGIKKDSVDMANVLGLLIKANQEQQKEIEYLKERINKLEGEI